MNLIEPSNLIDSKIFKISKTDRSSSSIGGNSGVGTSLSSFFKGGENMSETKFEVSFDGDFSRDCEFIVSLPIMDSNSSDSSDGSDFLYLDKSKAAVESVSPRLPPSTRG